MTSLMMMAGIVFSANSQPSCPLEAVRTRYSSLNSYESGVERYIAKPFSPQILLMQISNLLHLKENLQKKSIANQLPLDEVVSDSKDKQLVGKIEQYIRDHFDNEELSINDIVAAVGLSRTLLYVKLKSTVGLSATQFITNICLKESLKLLMQDYIFPKWHIAAVSPRRIITPVASASNSASPPQNTANPSNKRTIRKQMAIEIP